VQWQVADCRTLESCRTLLQTPSTGKKHAIHFWMAFRLKLVLRLSPSAVSPASTGRVSSTTTGGMSTAPAVRMAATIPSRRTTTRRSRIRPGGIAP
jgi:hypothetical protein